VRGIFIRLLRTVDAEATGEPLWDVRNEETTSFLHRNQIVVHSETAISLGHK